MTTVQTLKLLQQYDANSYYVCRQVNEMEMQRERHEDALIDAICDNEADLGDDV
jgi:hypothetical protein